MVEISKEKKMGRSKVLAVKEVAVTLMGGNSSAVNITAQGVVPTSAWQGAELVAYVYLAPPADGIYDFDFIANAPDGASSQVITDIGVTHVVTSPPAGLRGVRIHATTNAKQAMLSAGGGNQKTVFVRGVLTDEGAICQALRAESGELYTIVGDLKGFKVGDKVFVAGTLAEISSCMQGQTIVIAWIGKGAPKL